MVYLREEVLYEIFINIQKYYNALYQDRCLDILKGCGVGTQSLLLLIQYWYHLVMMVRSSSYHGETLEVYREVTKVSPLSPDIFNFVVYNILHHWLT